MSKLDRIQQKIEEMRRDGTVSLTIEELKSVLLAFGVLEGWQRKAMTMALEARGVVKLEGNILVLR